MKLLLTSGGLSNDSIISALKDLTQKPFNEANLTFIPTAANVEEGDKSWLVEDMYNFKKLAKETSSTFYAIDDNTAIKVLNNEVSVISEGEWKKFN